MMYPVTQDFIDKMRADKRQVDVRVTIDYTDPEIDQSIAVSAPDQANVSYPQQMADGVAKATHKWASLDGSWVLDGSYRLAPEPQDLTRFQFGWWGSQLAGADGAFAAPYPTLTVTHIPRPVHFLRVVGDSARGEYPVDFRIDLYAQDGTLLRSETVTDNAAVEWSKTLPTPVLDVAKQVLTITKWSHPGRQAKILEFFTSIQETYESGDVVEIRLLEEREASQGSLPVGNVSANEIAIRLANEGGKFDVTNQQSPLWGLLKPNRRIRAWLGALAENQDSENPPTFTRNSVAYTSTGQQVGANQPRFETIGGRTGVLVEEGTTNIGSPASLFDDSWVLVNGTSTILDTYTRKYTFTSTPIGAFAYKTFTLTTGVAYTWSAEIKGEGSTVGKQVRLQSSAESAYGTPVTLTTEWQRVTLTFTATATSRVVGFIGIPVNAFAAGDVVYIRNFQWEQKPYATSFIDGTRSPETLTVPTAGVLDPSEGTIEFFFVPTTPQASVPWGRWFGWGGGHSYPVTKNDFRCLWGTGRGLNNLAVEVADKTQMREWSSSIQFTQNLQPGRLYYVCVVWQLPGYVKIVGYDYTTGELRSNQTSINAAPNFSKDGSARIGTNAEGYEPVNWIFHAVRISRRARTDQEIAAAYAVGKLELDEDTTYLLTMNGSIYPVEQVWVPLGTFWSLDWDSPDDTLEASVTARDRLELLRKSTYQPGAVQQNVSLYTLADQVLRDAGLKPGEYAIDTALQSIVVPWAWLSPASHREALRTIAEAGLAVVYADRDGVVRVESMTGAPTTPVAEITEDDYFPPLSAPSRQDQVANEVVVTTQPLRPASTTEEVYRSMTPISVPAGQTVTVTAFYTKQPVIEASASLDSPPAGVSITNVTYYAWGADVKIQNTGGAAANVTLVVTGKPLSVQGGEQVIARDQTSIIENGVLRYEYPANPLVQTLAQAQAIANALLASAKDPRRDIEVEWRGNPAVELGDRVKVVGQDVHVIRQEITWAGAMSARLTGRKVT